jgi:hypothetical protein
MKQEKKQENKSGNRIIFDGLDLLLRKRTGPCLSIIIEFHSEPAKRKYNDRILHAALEKASRLLENYECRANDKQHVIAELQRFALSFDACKCDTALGVFIAHDVTRLVFFPFAVNEIILVADSFEIRDVLLLRQYLSPYYVLHFDKKNVRLLIGHADHLQEIRDDRFPVSLAIEPHKPADDKRNPETAEQKIMQTVGRHVLKYLAGSVPTLLLAGAPKLARTFEKNIKLGNTVVGHILENFSVENLKPLARMAWKSCTALRNAAMDRQIAKLDGESPRYRAKGLRQVWRAALKGQGLVLLVEKDYRRPAYVPQGTDEIRLHTPKGQYKFVADAVDDVIEKVLSKNGHVLLTESHRLGKFENIGMMLRY